jgi:molybdopterin converting factor small subunit
MNVPVMNVSVQMFAAARQLCGCPVVEVELPPGATVAELREALAARYPNLRPLLPHLKFAIEREYAPDHQVVPADVEIACIPPVSGG